MVTRTTVTTMTLALGLTLTGCTGQADQATPSESQPVPTESTATAAPTEEATGEAAAEDVELPEFLEPYPDAEVLSSSRAQAESGDLEAVSLVMKAEADPKDIVDFYTERLEKAGFETFGKDSMTKAAQVVNFRHKDNDGMLVITISDDPDGEKSSIVTVGGNVAP